MIGPWEIFLVLLVVLVVFGAGRLPSVMGDVAKGVKAFKQGLRDEDSAQKPTDDPKKITHQNVTAPEKTRQDV